MISTPYCFYSIKPDYRLATLMAEIFGHFQAVGVRMGCPALAQAAKLGEYRQ
jgi:hypothetical protein